MDMKNDFLGRGWSFPPTFNKTEKELKMAEGLEDIKESLYILLNTSQGERVMNPDYGCNMRSFVFSNLDNSRITFLKDLIATAILKYEPRIDVQEIDIDNQNYLDGVITIEIDYIIKTTNSRANIVFPFYLSEGTLVDL
jgi:phage baseplate assembly protein W